MSPVISPNVCRVCPCRRSMTSHSAEPVVAGTCLRRWGQMALCACLTCATWSTAPSSTRTPSTTRCSASAGTNKTPTTWPPWRWMEWRSALHLFACPSACLSHTSLYCMWLDQCYSNSKNACLVIWLQYWTSKSQSIMLNKNSSGLWLYVFYLSRCIFLSVCPRWWSWTSVCHAPQWPDLTTTAPVSTASPGRPTPPATFVQQVSPLFPPAYLIQYYPCANVLTFQVKKIKINHPFSFVFLSNIWKMPRTLG